MLYHYYSIFQANPQRKLYAGGIFGHSAQKRGGGRLYDPPIERRTARRPAFSGGVSRFGYTQRANSFSHFSSTERWAASSVHSLPGWKQCLKRPWSFMNSVTGSFFLGS